MKNKINQSLILFLEQLSHILEAHGLVAETAPDDHAMTSSAPFACDTMTFEQWLQFIFIPRMHACIEQNNVPNTILVAPAAEELMAASAGKTAVVATLHKIDLLLSE
ncbi:YqcC family protein [Aestuariibacter sp. AA17]|uniref:YqcC family protein n=1 Tax=Fluctibacter corallii TaxID=2984329 RepID=A0ABT3A8G5_9ALTE|nr:YqcC family protein [Aestuariibacter sp. AA17]MCV2884978.1 YqcC family protein [Aestuariibacter sp. AA17]